jgi:flagellar hook-associated protein 2
MDIDSIVAKMMKAERVPLDKLEQKKQTLEWQQTDYRSLNTTLIEFKTNSYDARLERTFLVRNADSSSTGVATATAASSAADGTYNIKVNQLATGVSKASTAELANGKNTDGSSLTLFEQFSELGARGYLATDNISVTINGETLEFDLDVDNMTTVASKINQAELGITASYDSTLNRFFLNSNSTGSNAEISIASDAAGLFANLGVDDNTSILKLNVNQGVSYTGQNASVDFGDATGLVSSTNAITVNGITINLKGQGSSTITVTRNIEGVIDSITKFVDSYNKTLKTLYDKVQEERDPDYPPLTDAQKSEMSDSQIEDWEKKAKSGLLRNDERLKSMINSFRSAAYTAVSGVDGAYNSLNSIGIKSEAYDNSGQLVIDKDALREALTKDPDAVKQMFTSSSTDDSKKGVAVKVYEKALSGITYIADKAGNATSTGTVDSSIIGKKISKLSDEIDDWEEKLKKKEDKYYDKFTKMETAIYKMNAQSSWLTTMLGS